MTVLTRRGGGSWMSVSNAGYYGSTVANYAAALQQAQESQINTEIENKVFSYKQGLITYDELSTYLKTRLSTLIAGSQKELDMKQLISQLDAYENEKQKDLKRAALESKYSKNGISATEQALIEQEMLQYYKVGTPEYAQQQSNIATAMENKRQDDNNRRVSELEAKLSSGGLTTKEQIEVAREARSLSEPNSEDQFTLDKRIGDLEMKLEEEERVEAENQRVDAANQVQSDLLDELISDDGQLSLDDSLRINLEMQQFFEPGSENYISLKQEEAQLRQNIADEQEASGKSGAGQRSKALADQFTVDDTKLDNLFNDRQITADEYIRQKQELYNSAQESGAVKFNEEELKEIAKLDGLLEGLNSGKYLTVLKDGRPEIVPNDPGILASYATDEGKVAGFGEDGKVHFSIEEDGKIVRDATYKEVMAATRGDKNAPTVVPSDTGKSSVVNILSDRGEVVKTRVNERGQLEVLGEMSTVGGAVLVPTGRVWSGKSTNVSKTWDEAMKREETQKGVNMSKEINMPSWYGTAAERYMNYLKQTGSTKYDKYAQQVMKEGRLSVPEGAEGFAGITPEENKKLQKLELKPSGNRKAFTTLATQPKGGEKTLHLANISKSSTGFSSGFSTSGGFSGGGVNSGVKPKSVGDILGTAASKINLSGTPGKIPGTKDYGVTEAFSSLVSGVTDKIKDLFKKDTSNGSW